MLTRPLGNTTLPVSVLALSTDPAVGNPTDWGSVDDNERIDAIRQAVDAGINLIDTSAVHGLGRAEVLVGRAIRGRRDRVLIATKCGAWVDERTGRLARCLTAESIHRECDASLRRLQTDVIDLYQCRWPDPETPIRETMEALTALLETGKIRAIGLCDFGCERLADAREFGPVHAVQSAFSVLNRQAALDLIPYCRECGTAFIARDPWASGLLTDRGRLEDATGAGPAPQPDIARTRPTEHLSAAEKTRTIAHAYGKTVGQLAVNWVAHRPGITTVMVSAGRPSQVREACDSIGWELRPADAAAIDALLPDS